MRFRLFDGFEEFRLGDVTLEVDVRRTVGRFEGAQANGTVQPARQVIDTNFFGTLWVCQAVAPHLRAQRSGHILQMSSIAGLTGIPTQGLYAAGKFAVEWQGRSYISLQAWKAETGQEPSPTAQVVPTARPSPTPPPRQALAR